MNNFKYYIFDPLSFKVCGTSSGELAKDCAECEDYFVIQLHTSEVLTPGGTREQIENIPETRRRKGIP